MKNLKLILFTAFLAGAVLIIYSCGTTKTTSINDEKAPFGTRVIEVKTNLSPKEAYQKVAQVLQDKGFIFAHTDATLMSISTEPKECSERINALSSRYVDIRITADVRKDEFTKIILRGSYDNKRYDEPNFLDIEKEKYDKDSHLAWKFLHEIAETIGGKLSYRKGDSYRR